MSITFDSIVFARSHYDPRGDVLYLSVSGYQGPPWDAHCGDEGHNVEFDESGRVIAMTIVGARWWLARDGALTITLPTADLTPQELAALGGSSTLRASQAELAPALTAVA